MKKFLFSPYSLLFLILIIAVFLRFYNPTGLPPGLYPDEAMDGTNAQEALSTGQFKVFYPENNGREGLFMNIQAITISLLGNEPWSLRIVSAFFGIFTVLGIYFFTKQLFHPLVFAKGGAESNAPYFSNKKPKIISKISATSLALFSAFLVAVSFWHIMFSRISFRAIMAPFFAVWAFYLLLKALNHEKYILSSVVGGIFLGLGFYSYIAYRPLPLVALIILFLYWREHKDKNFRNKIIQITGYFLITAFLVALPIGVYFMQNPRDFFGRTSELSITSSATPLKDLAVNIIKTAGMFNFVGDWNWRQNYAGRPELFWPVGLFFLWGLFLGIKNLARSRKLKKSSSAISSIERKDLKHINLAFTVLASWIAIAALPVVISNEGIPHALRSILTIPPVFILAGLGGIWFYYFIKEAIIKYSRYETDIKQIKTANHIFFFNIAVGLFLFLLFFEAYYTYFVAWGQNPNVSGAFSADYAAIGYELRKMPDSVPKYVVVQASGVLVRGVPMPAQTVMFLTDTFTPEKQKAKNIHYILPNQTSQIPAGAYVVYLR